VTDRRFALRFLLHPFGAGQRLAAATPGLDADDRRLVVVRLQLVRAQPQFRVEQVVVGELGNPIQRAGPLPSAMAFRTSIVPVIAQSPATCSVSCPPQSVE